jgi:hypothetical protein
MRINGGDAGVSVVTRGNSDQQRSGQGIAIVVSIHLNPEGNLPQIADTNNALRPRFGEPQRREQQGGENGDDGDDHHELGQGETRFLAAVSIHALLDTI